MVLDGASRRPAEFAAGERVRWASVGAGRGISDLGPSPAGGCRLLLPLPTLRTSEDPLPSRRTFTSVPLALLAVAAGCARDKPSSPRDSAASAAPQYSLAGVAGAPIAATSYTVAPVARGGRVRGTVEIEGALSPDSVVHPISDQEVCGDSIVDVLVDHDGARLEGAVVWLADVKTGKRLPLARRYDLSIESCRMLPRTQAVVVGGTLNVSNADRAQHHTRFLRQGTRDPIAFAPYSDEGQVVPVTAALARPGLVEARCDVHPWGRAWVAVFDQPYFAVTARDGGFVLDSVPPGKYTLVAWHPRLGIAKDTVRVGPDGESVVALRLKAR